MATQKLDKLQKERDALWDSVFHIWKIANQAMRDSQMGGNPHTLFLEQVKANEEIWKTTVNIIGLDPNNTQKIVFLELMRITK